MDSETVLVVAIMAAITYFERAVALVIPLSDRLTDRARMAMTLAAPATLAALTAYSVLLVDTEAGVMLVIGPLVPAVIGAMAVMVKTKSLPAAVATGAAVVAGLRLLM